MNAILFLLHMLGFGTAFGASVGNAAILRLVAAAPADAPVLGKVPPVLARIGQVGLAFLWATGLIMVWSVYGGPQNLPGLFWIKFVCVIGVTGGVVMLDLTMRAVRAGDQAARARLPLYGAATGALLLLVVIFAVLSFYEH